MLRVAASSVLLLGVQAEAQEKDWAVTTLQVSGNTSNCGTGGRMRIREGNGRIAGLSSDGRTELWSIRQAADGSASDETKALLLGFPRIRLKIPAGAGPRPFEYLNLNQGCQYKAIPD